MSPIILDEPAPGATVPVPGLDANHTWNGGLTLYGPGDENLPLPPYLEIRKIDNWRSLPDTTDVAEPADSRGGEIPRSIRRLGKTVAYDGVIVARNPSDLHTLTDEMLQAFQPTEADGLMVVDGFFNSDTYFYNARSLTLVINEEFTKGPTLTRSGGWERPFVLSLKMHDPKFYLSTESFYQSDTFTSSPTDMPWSWTVNTSGYNTGAVSRAVPYSGLAPGTPILTLWNDSGASGDVVAPRVANGATQTGIRFSESIVIHPGQWLELDFKQRKVTQGGAGDVDWGRVADWSDWWDDGIPGLLPGVTQTIYGGGKTLSTNTFFTIRFNPARY